MFAIPKHDLRVVSYRTPEELFAELPATYLWAVKVPDEAVWWSQKDLAEHAGCPLPRYESAERHWAWLQKNSPASPRQASRQMNGIAHRARRRTSAPVVMG